MADHPHGQPGATSVVDRASGQLVPEVVYNRDELVCFYHTPLGHVLRTLVLRRPWFSRFYGWFKRHPRSRPQIAAFVARYGIDTQEAEKPLDAYASFDEFFTRRLKPGTRAVDPDPDHLVSPADGRILVYPVARGEVFPVKGGRWTVAQLLGGRVPSALWEDGAAAVIRLAGADYHRFHFSDDGTPLPAIAIPGRLDAVHPIALDGEAGIYPRNQRMLTVFESAHFGRMALIELGAMTVGRIVQTFTPGQPVSKGQEKGYFRFGGSAMVLLFEPGAVAFDADLLAWTARGYETRVQMGSRIGSRAANAARETP